jgi:PKD repeat protein
MNKKNIRYGITSIGLFVMFLAFAPIANAQINSYVPVRAVIKTTPSAGNNIVRLPIDGGSIGIFLGESVGDISEYQIDLNILEDSSGDNIKDNDIDNSFHSSLKTGGTFPISIRPGVGETERKIKVKVIGLDGSENDAVITVMFGGEDSTDDVVNIDLSAENRPLPQDRAKDDVNELSIVVDREELVVGEMFNFEVQNVPAETSEYVWDFQIDGEEDARTIVPYLTLDPEAAGTLKLRITLLSEDGSELGKSDAEFVINDISGNSLPIENIENVGNVHIDVTTKGSNANFQTVLPDHLDAIQVDPVWDFGDGDSSYLLNPVHAYTKSGEYDVSLSLTDAVTKMKIGSAVTRVSVTIEPVVDTGGSGFFGSIAFILKVTFFVFVLLVLISGIVFVFIFLKSQREGVPLGEVISRYKKRLTGEMDSGASEKKEDIVTAEVVKEEVAGYKKPEPVVMKDVNEEAKESKEVKETEVKKTEEKKDVAPKPPLAGIMKDDQPKVQAQETKKVEEKPEPEPEPEPEPKQEPEHKPLIEPDKKEEERLASETSKPKPKEVPTWLKDGIEEAAPEEKEGVLKGDISKAVESGEGISEKPKEEVKESKEENKVEDKNEAEEPIAFIKAEGVEIPEEKDDSSENKADAAS